MPFKLKTVATEHGIFIDGQAHRIHYLKPSYLVLKGQADLIYIRPGFIDQILNDMDNME